MPTAVVEFMTLIPRLQDGEQKVFFQAGGEWCYIWTPETFLRDKPVSVVIHHHGARGYVRNGSAEWLDEENKAAILRAVMAGEMVDRAGFEPATFRSCGRVCLANRMFFGPFRVGIPG